MIQQARRRNPYPWTWEIPLGVVVAVGLLLVSGVHLGRALAIVLNGGGWRFPPRALLVTSLPDVLGGDAGAGLVSSGGPLASPVTLWVCLAATELVLVVSCLLLLTLGLQRWGPARVRGVASRGEAESLLGVARLRRVRGVVRPDLYRSRRHPW